MWKVESKSSVNGKWQVTVVMNFALHEGLFSCMLASMENWRSQ